MGDEINEPKFDRYAAAQEMLIEEYKRYSEGIQQRVRLAYETERNFLIAIATIYTWLFAPPAKAIETTFGGHAIWVPVFLSVVVLWRLRSYITGAHWMRDYVVRIEELYDRQGRQGDLFDFDSRISALRIAPSVRRKVWHDRLGVSRTWLVILVVNILIAATSELVHFGFTFHAT